MKWTPLCRWGLGPAMVVLFASSLSSTCSGGLIGVLEEISPTPHSYIQGVDFNTFASSGGGTVALGDVTGSLEAVPGLGDQPADFAGFIPGGIALIERGAAFFSTKVNLAADAGAIGVLIYNDQPGLNPVSFATDTTIPALFTTNAVGQGLLAQLSSGPVVIHLSVVPEPSTLTQAGIGGFVLLGLYGICRRRAASTAIR